MAIRKLLVLSSEILAEYAEKYMIICPFRQRTNASCTYKVQPSISDMTIATTG